MRKLNLVILPLEIPKSSLNRKLLWFLFFAMLMVLQSCSDKGKLTGPTITLEMIPIRWGCDCADWIPINEFTLYDFHPDTLAAHCVFIEPASDEIVLPESYSNTGHTVRFTGRFYEKPGFPDGYDSVEDVDEAKVFRYTSFELIKSE